MIHVTVFNLLLRHAGVEFAALNGLVRMITERYGRCWCAAYTFTPLHSARLVSPQGRAEDRQKPSERKTAVSPPDKLYALNFCGMPVISRPQGDFMREL